MGKILRNASFLLYGSKLFLMNVLTSTANMENLGAPLKSTKIRLLKTKTDGFVNLAALELVIVLPNK